MRPVRPFREDDIPQVADLNWAFLRHGKGTSPPALRSFFQELYFTNPWRDNAIPSLVYEDKDGKIVGFLGVIPRKMSFRGRCVRVAFGGNFVVHPEARSTLAALHLLRTYMAGEQDLSQTDSANNISRRLLRGLGFSTILPYSIHWARPVRPSQYAAYAVSSMAGPGFAAFLKYGAKPFCSAIDAIATRLSSSPFHQRKSRLQAIELELPILLQCFAEFRNGYSLFPQYDLSSLNWLFTLMGKMEVRGDLRKVLLLDSGRKIIGWYVYYAKSGAIGEVVQIGGAREFIMDILDHLFHDAWSHGVIGLHGVVDRRLMDDFSEKNCFFTCRGGWMLAHSRNPALLESLNSGDAFLSRLDGEWCLDYGGDS